MKIIIIVLSLSLLTLGAKQLLLYWDHEDLQARFHELQANYDRLQNQPKSSCVTDKNTRLINPHAQMAPGLPLTQSQTTDAAVDEITQLQQKNIAQSLEQKYALLFSQLNLSHADQARMRDLLLKRETILNSTGSNYFTSEADLKASIEKQQALVADIDQKISQLLKPEDIKTYELLKDSAYEQYQMNMFYQQLGSKDTLPQEKRTSLLLSKLEQKKAFSDLLQNSATNIENATPEEKRFLTDKLHDALHDYKDNYLRLAKQNLTDEQFNILREYEQNQFEEIWQSLKAGWQIE